MSQTSHADANLLFGVLAFQNGFISRDQLIAGMQAWVEDKRIPLDKHLLLAGAIAADVRQLLQPLVAAHIRQHDGDAEKSLASIGSAAAIKRDLSGILDSELQHSLTRLPAAQRPPRDEFATLTLGASSSSGTRFQILRPHARGGLGEVFVARDTELGREVALKEIQLDKDDPESRARFTREAEITGGLEHPGIISVYGLGAYPDGRPFYAMRFIRGKSLQDAIRAHHEIEVGGQRSGVSDPHLKRERGAKSATEKNLELRRLLQRFIDVCEAIDYAHSRGVLHRDLKPGNIMLGRYGETLVVDWGLAKPLGEIPASHSSDSLKVPQIKEDPAALAEAPLIPSSHGSSEQTVLGSALGTPAYMSPEQAQGRIDLLGPASDVFSLGATLYHLLTSRPPYAGKNVVEIHSLAQRGEYPRPRALQPDIPRALEAICLKAMTISQDQRYASAKELADEVERYLADEPVQALPESVTARAGRWARRNRHWVQAGGVALMLVALTATAAYFYQRETAAQNRKLAVEKGKLAEEKSGLALKESQARQEAEARAAELHAALVHSHFAHGTSEYAAGREESGVLDLQRAWAMAGNGDPLKPHFEQVLLDHATRGGRSLLQPARHESTVIAVAFSPQGDRVLTASFDHTAQLWDANTGAPVGAAMQHDEIVNAAAFSPQGDRVLTGSADKTARLWDAKTGAPLGKPLQHAYWVEAVAFSPQGDRVLTGTSDSESHGVAQLWDAKHGTQLGEPMRHDDGVHAVAFNSPGDRVLTGSHDQTARLWDAYTGAPLGEPMRHEGWVDGLAFSPQGDRVLTGSRDNSARLWDAKTGGSLGDPMRHTGWVLSVAFSPQGDRVLTGSGDNTARLWDAKTGAPLGEPMRHDDVVMVTVFSPQGDRVLTGSGDKTARLWNGTTGAPLGEPLRHADGIEAVAFSPQGDRIVTGSADNTARLWDAKTGVQGGELLRHASAVTSVAFSSQGDRVLTGSGDQTARLWDTRTGAPIGEPMRHDDVVTVAAFSPQGDRVLTAGLDKLARLWDAKTSAPVGKPMRHDDVVRVAVFSPQGDQVLTASTDNAVRLWDAKTGAPVSEPLLRPGRIFAAAFSPQGNLVLASIAQGTTLRLCDAQTGAKLGEPMPHEAFVFSVAFSPQADRVLTGSTDGTARLWDVKTGTLQGEPMRHGSIVNSVVFSPQGNRVITGGIGAARLWDAQTGAPLGEPLRHAGDIGAVVFSPQGDQVLTGGGDGIVRLWDVAIPPCPNDVTS